MTGADIPGVPVERAIAVREFSAEARGAAVHNMVAAEMYHRVQTGTPRAVRQAAQWIITGAGVKPSSLHLDDEGYLAEKKLTHLIAAEERVVEAERIESWAGSFLEVGDSPDVVALKSLSWVEGLYLTDIERRPRDMLKFEDETVTLGESIGSLRTEIADISEKLDQGTGLESVNIALGVKQHKSSRGRPRAPEIITAVDLASLQREILTERVEAEETKFRNRTELMEALRTGQLSEGLRAAIAEKAPRDADSPRDESPADEIRIEELDFGVHTYTRLSRNSIRTLDQLAGKTEEELRAMPGFNDSTINEILETLGTRGLDLRAAD